MEPRQKRAERRRPALDAGSIEDAGLFYLSRYSASAARVRQVLMRRVQRGSETPEAANEAAHVVDQLIIRWLHSGILNDARYAEAKATSLHRKGSSARMIAARLQENGIDRSNVTAALTETGTANAPRPGGDFAAAITLARRRRLGPFKISGRGDISRERELAIFARAGFARAVAERILSLTNVNEVEQLVTELNELVS